MKDITKRNIMRKVGGTGASIKLGKRTLDNLGYIKSQCCFPNDQQRIEKLERQARLAASIEEIKEYNDRKKKEEQVAASEAMLTGCPESLKKLKDKGGDLTKITKKEIVSILFTVYRIVASDKL